MWRLRAVGRRDVKGDPGWASDPSGAGSRSPPTGAHPLAMGDRRSTVIVIGPVPPPHHGVSVMTKHVIEATRLCGRLADHLDTSDPRPLETIGRLDFQNVRLGLRHAAILVRMLVKHPEASVYLPISQVRWGFLRDALFLVVARLWRRPIYVHLHGGSFGRFYDESSQSLRRLIRWTLSGVTQAWVLTPSLRINLERFVDPERIHVVENVVADPGVASKQSIDASFRVLSLANLLPEKGSEELLAALLVLGELARGWEIRLIGEPHSVMVERLRPAVERLSALGVGVAMPGVRTGREKDAELHAADLFVYPTRYREEGQPLVLLEAMAAGLPIITTRLAGIPDTLVDGVHAALVEPGDVYGLAAEIGRLHSDARRRSELGRAARQRYEEFYVPARLARDLSALLDE